MQIRINFVSLKVGENDLSKERYAGVKSKNKEEIGKSNGRRRYVRFRCKNTNRCDMQIYWRNAKCKMIEKKKMIFRQNVIRE